jgi:hypothetical protein
MIRTSRRAGDEAALLVSNPDAERRRSALARQDRAPCSAAQCLVETGTS